jgi:hypothetical protein
MGMRLRQAHRCSAMGVRGGAGGCGSRPPGETRRKRPESLTLGRSGHRAIPMYSPSGCKTAYRTIPDACSLCGIWPNCKSFLLALRRRADRVMPEFEWIRLLSI